MLDKKKYIYFMVTILIVFIGVVYLNNKDSSTNNPVSYPDVNLSYISEEEYIDGVDKYSLNPMMNGKNKTITLFYSDDLSYYKAKIKDEGYNDELPIDVEVFFATDENNNLLEDSYFIVTESKNLSDEKLKFLNTIVLVEEFGGRDNSAYITLIKDTVYNNEANFDFKYTLSVALDLLELEVIQLSK